MKRLLAKEKEVTGSIAPLLPIIKKRKKVAIVGYAPSSRMLAPYGSDEFDIWGVNELYKVVPRVDVLFEIHDFKWLSSKERNPQHLEWLANSAIPIVMIDTHPAIPKSIKYPIEHILKKYGRYFTNSISYLIALAIEMGYEELHMYGIDMATTDDTGNAEYMRQRPSVEYYLGVARGAGIKVYIPPQSDICKTMFLYGYEDDQITQSVLKTKARRKELQERINSYRATAEHNITAMNQMMGALDDLEYWDRCWQNQNYNGNEWSPWNQVQV